MKPIVRFSRASAGLASLTLALVVIPTLGLAETPDPEAFLREMQQLDREMQEKLRVPTETGSRVDTRPIREAIRNRSLAFLAQTDPLSSPRETAYAWAKVYRLTDDFASAYAMTLRYLENPGAPEQQAATRDALDFAFFSRTPDHRKVQQILETRYELSSSQDAHWLSGWVRRYGPYLRLTSLEQAQHLSAWTFDRIAKKLSKDAAASALLMLKEFDAWLWMEADRPHKALEAIDQAFPYTQPDTWPRRDLQNTRKMYAMLGKPAPPLGVGRFHGAYTPLPELKGHVVLLDFFSHWCGPCKAAYPGLGKLQSELGSKGVQVYGITTYYGYFGEHKKGTWWNTLPDGTRVPREGATINPSDVMPEAEEFDRMRPFMKEFGITWPVLYVESKTFREYFVTGVPHLLVLDKQGIVRRIQVGFSSDVEISHRRFIESLLSQP